MSFLSFLPSILGKLFISLGCSPQYLIYIQGIYSFPGKFLGFLGCEIADYLACSIEKGEFRMIQYFIL